MGPERPRRRADAYRFDGFGVQIAKTDPTANPFRYRGLLNIGADAVLGALLDMGARDYAPGLGSFTSVDSVQGSAANPLTMNRYLYALANPATLIDPDGHMALVDGLSGGGSSTGTTGGTTAARTKTITSMQRAIDCGFEGLGCRSDNLANIAGFGFGVGQAGWDMGAGVLDFGIGAVGDTLCVVNPMCGPDRAREQALAAQARDAQLRQDWQDPGAALSAGFSGVFDGIAGFADRVFNGRSGFEAWREVGYAGTNVASLAVPAAGAARGMRLAGATTAMLTEHKLAAVNLFESGVRTFTLKQSARIKLNPNLRPAYRGERIDTFFKEMVIADPRLASRVQVTPRFTFGPDVRPVSGSGWWDLTTAGQWQAHDILYGPSFGVGTPLLYK